MHIMKEITITEGHLALLRRTYMWWDDRLYEGAPAVNSKRPYGNSDLLRDIYETTVPGALQASEEFWEDFAESMEEEFVNLRTQMMKIHHEMETVIQITLNLAGRGELITTGTYYLPIEYDVTEWLKKKKEN